MPAPLVCPVRGCRRPLERSADGRTFACAARHAFDVARSGYLNLLQPQDRRSRRPGDAREALLARARLAEAGLQPPVAAEVLRVLDELCAAPTPTVLDVGCGDGRLLAELSAAREAQPIDAHGVDISVPAIELAARRFPAAQWVVANADRGLPWKDGAFDLVVSVTARRDGPEFARVLTPAGLAIVAVPAEDDLVELREAVHGRATKRDRAAAVVGELSPPLELVRKTTVRTVAELGASSLRDLLTATYRGARMRERERATALASMSVTSSRDVLVFQKQKQKQSRGGSRPDP